MRQHLLPILWIASLALSACGSSTEGVLAGKTPEEIVQLTSAAIDRSSARFTVDGSYAVDTSRLHGVSAEDLRSFAGPLASSVAFSATGEQEGSRRVSATFSVRSAPPRTVYVVVYDGRTYVSLDGRRYRDAVSLTTVTGPLGVTPDGVKAYVGAASGLTDVGGEQRDGQTVEHLHGVVDNSSLDKIAGNNQLLQLLRQVSQVRGGSVDLYVRRSDAMLDRAILRARVDVDLDPVLRALGGLSTPAAPGLPAPRPGGTATLSLNLDIHYTDVGAPVHVVRPAVDPTAPTLPPGGGLLPT